MIQVKDLSPPADRYPVRRALLSVFDKEGLAEFGARLHALGVELISTGGTARVLREANLPVTDVAALTGSPELLDGRVKTLHPAVHAAILARRTDAEDLAQLEEHGIAPIDLVVVNLYPFSKAIEGDEVSEAHAAEHIDIGGPTMVRAAAKNWFFVGVITDPERYGDLAGELEKNRGTLGLDSRRALALDAFRHTAAYDAAITSYLSASAEPSRQTDAAPAVLPDVLRLDLPQAQPLRYGENPHQAAALYSLSPSRLGGEPEHFYRQLHGKSLSFNNLLDLSAALRLIAEFEDAAPTLAILKHTNPCGVGTADTLAEAHTKAFATDQQSPFGGIVVVNRPLDLEAAEAIDGVFTELIIAPSYEEGVLDFLKQKQNRRLIEIVESASKDIALDVRSVVGGMLVQEPDPSLEPAQSLQDAAEVSTARAPTASEWADLDFAWRVCKHVKSNAIVYARDGATLGIGAGQMSRIDASELAIRKGTKSELDFAGCVVASDAFFPFADGLVAAAEAGATAVIQPGGSVRDNEVIAAADARGLAMVFTGRRHFRH